MKNTGLVLTCFALNTNLKKTQTNEENTLFAAIDPGQHFHEL